MNDRRHRTDLTPLVDLAHRRWSIPIIAELHRQRGAKFVTLVNTLGVSRASLSMALNDLIELAAPYIGEARVVERQLKKWRYATPTNLWPDTTCLIDVDGFRLALAGDAFAGPKTEGAFLSGLGSAKALG